jgi:GABA permease
MRRYLIVANRTLTGPHVVAEIAKRSAEGDAEFHLLVPIHPAHATFWTEGQAQAGARAQLDQALQTLRDAGVEATGEVGEENVVRAVGDVINRQPVDEIILSTLPPGVSRWLKRDLPHKLAHRYHLPVTHIVAERVPAH